MKEKRKMKMKKIFTQNSVIIKSIIINFSIANFILSTNAMFNDLKELSTGSSYDSSIILKFNII